MLRAPSPVPAQTPDGAHPRGVRRPRAATFLAVLAAASAGGATATAADDGFRFDPGSVVALAQVDDAEAGAILDPADDAAAAAPAAAPLGEPRLLELYGTEGQTRFRFLLGYGVSVKDSDDTLFSGGVGVSHFIADDLALAFELNGLWFRQEDLGEDEDVAGANFNVLFQWHFVNRRDWSLFLEGGAGVLVSTGDVPANGSSFNFTPQLGVGATFALSRDVRLLGGVRWHHVSNANLFDDNPGRDSIMGYVGVELPF